MPQLSQSHSRGSSPSCADDIYNFFHEPFVVLVLSTLLIVDILCVILGISFEIQYLDSKVDDYKDVVESCQDEILNSTSAGVNACDPYEMGREFYSHAERIVFWTSIIILSIFLIESIVLFIAKPVVFFFDKGRMLDFTVVTVSLLLELLFDSSNVGGLVVAGRLVRFVRIGHGVYDETSKECDSCIENGKLLHQLDSLNEDRAVIKAYEMMLASGGPETVDTELMDNILHVVGAHLKEKKELLMEMIEDHSPPQSPISYRPPKGGEDVYTRM